MKKLLLLIFLLPVLVSAQKTTPGNYTYVAQKYEWDAGIFKGLGLPAGPGPAAFIPGQVPRAGALYYDSSGVDEGLYNWTGLSWQLVGSGGAVLHGSEFTSSNDTLYLGGGRQTYNIVNVIPSSRGLDHLKASMYFANRGGDSNRFVTNFHHAVSAQDATYEASLVRLNRRYEEAWGDTLNNLTYGGAIEASTWNRFDSTSTRFRYDNKPIRIPNGAGHFLQDVFLPRDSVHWSANRDGQSASVAKFDLNIGDFWGYNVKIVPFADRYPINVVQSSIDFIRNIDNTREKTLNGPITGFIAQWKAYQSLITSATPEVGNYWSGVYDYTSYGDLYATNIAHASATKAKVLAVAKMDSAGGILLMPKYREKNQVANGVGVAQYGIYDRNLWEGKSIFGTYVPGSKVPGIDSALHTVNIRGSLNVTDSVFHKKDILATDTANAYIGLYDKTTGLEKKINPYQLGFSIGTPGIDDVLAQGQDLTTNRTIDADVNVLSVTGSSASGTLSATNTGIGASLQGTSVSTGTGVYGISDGGTGVRGSSNTGVGIFGQSSATESGSFETNVASTNTVQGILHLIRGTTGTAANGIGGSIRFSVERDNGATNSTTNEIISKYTTAADGSRTSELQIKGENNAASETFMRVLADGTVIVNDGADTLAKKSDLTGGGSGDVVGPGSATDGVPALFDGTTGKLIKNSTPTGTGNPVMQTSPTLTTPTVSGTVSSSAISVTITNASGEGNALTEMTARVNSDVTLANSAADQTLFGTTNDVWTLQGNTTYKVKGMYRLTSGSTTHTWAMGFTLGGGATISSILYGTGSWVTAVNATSTARTNTYIDQVASTVCTANSTTAAFIEFEGIIVMDAGGTVTPIIKASADPTGTILLKANSYISFIPIGNGTFEKIGNVN